MILALDAGNSRIKWGYFQAGSWVKTGVVAHEEIDSLSSILSKMPAPLKIVASNVAGVHVREKMLAAMGHLPASVIWPTSNNFCCGVRNGYAQPHQLGSDRWAALIGARREHSGAALVVNAGTALTIDTLTADGEFLGGLILPGIGMMMRALTTGTAQAHAAYGDFATFPTNTSDAIYSGAINAALGAIERMRHALAIRGAAPTCVISGGAAPVLWPHLTFPVIDIPNLVLLGLVTIAETLD